jgi:hypothetical protein
MQPKRIIPARKPESDLQKRIMLKLHQNGWMAKATHANEYQVGFPDVFAAHFTLGARWIECKQATGYVFTEAQLEDFPKLSNNGSGVWILTSDTDWEYNKLFKPQNWYTYLDVMKPVTRTRDKKPSRPYERSTRLASRGPERDIQEALKIKLAGEGWYVKETYGCLFQYGFPDLFATHKQYGQRWIECKNPTGYVFTPSQLQTFPMFNAHGVGVWVLTDASETPKLFEEQNWYRYLSVMR